jgi:predicted RNA-binding Zn-ribbon protein involved in translation (DUF1610 family)
MAAAKPVDEDGQLRPALQALEDAIWKLTSPTEQYLNSQLYTAPSLYLQLWDAVAGEQSNSGGGGGSKSQIPFWLDAFQLLDEIDVGVECWQPAFTGVPPTVGRLQHIQSRPWRPQDCRQIEMITKAVTEWAQAIDDLLNPKPRWTLPYPCPNCGADEVWRPDSTGVPVRSHALQLSPEHGCTCGKCKANWPPGKFLFLGRLLKTVPDNVGE